MLYLYLIITLLILTEIGAYFWHYLGTHRNIIPEFFQVQKTHNIHHNIIDDQAHGDFFYILIFLIVLAITLSYLWFKSRISYQLALAIYIPIFAVFIWNWYIHSAYHIENHWLNGYEWFQNDKRIHFQHHDNPSTNFGIATHFSDIIFNTFDYALLKDL